MAKNTTLSGFESDKEISPMLEAKLNIAIDEMTTSLATTPAIKALAIHHEPKPSGTNIGAKIFPKLSSILTPPSFVT